MSGGCRIIHTAEELMLLEGAVEIIRGYALEFKNIGVLPYLYCQIKECPENAEEFLNSQQIESCRKLCAELSHSEIDRGLLTELLISAIDQMNIPGNSLNRRLYTGGIYLDKPYMSRNSSIGIGSHMALEVLHDQELLRNNARLSTISWIQKCYLQKMLLRNSCLKNRTLG